ncbi:MAG: hypothetical protein MUQ27_01710 [Acidimicrobiia bacterium]|nr:hypothetical protein [Acidimicrobiia bacterium]
MSNLGGPELFIVAVSVGLLVLWIMGVVKLFQKGHTSLGWVAVVGIIIPVIALVGFAGWFVQDRSHQT